MARAFRWFLEHDHRGEPIFLLGHSQGALLAKMLVQEFFDGKPLAQSLGAAYLVGWTVFEEEFAPAGSTDPTRVHVCASPRDTRCVASWRTYARGGDPTAFLHIEPSPPLPRDARRVCTNPLTWERGPNSSHALSLIHI